VTGIVGGDVTGSTLDGLLAEMWTEQWYEQSRLETGLFGFGAVSHGTHDPGGTTVLNDGSRIGVVYGAITNRDTLGWTTTELFERVLNAPASTLEHLDGPFVIAAADSGEDRVVVGTDKLGTRRCYYTTSGRLLFGTSVAPLLEHLPDPTLDKRGLTDLLTIGQVWGGRTLISEVASMPPGGYLEYDGASETTTVARYWRQPIPGTGSTPSSGILADEYRRVLRSVTQTLTSTQHVGLWLSGGLDSRTMAAELSRHHDLVTYTYDANPPTGANLELAARVARALDVRNERVDLTADDLTSLLADGVELVDGMVPWVTFLNLSAIFSLPERPDVMFEGSGQGGLLGNDVWQADLERGRTPAEALYRSQHYVDRSLSEEILRFDVDPMCTYEEETAASSVEDFDGSVLEAYRRNFYPYGEFASNAVGRSQAGTRVPFADGDFLRLVSRIPSERRTKAIPLTGGAVPFGTAQYKLELCRELDSGLEQIPYERTGVKPARPRWQHAAGFVVTTAVDRLRSKPTYGGRTLAGEWYRNHDELRETVNALLDDVCDRKWVNDRTVRRLQRAHLEGEGEFVKPIACLTTAEQWIQTHL